MNLKGRLPVTVANPQMSGGRSSRSVLKEVISKSIVHASEITYRYGRRSEIHLIELTETVSSEDDGKHIPVIWEESQAVALIKPYHRNPAISRFLRVFSAAQSDHV
jgi:hypothetical protein